MKKWTTEDFDSYLMNRMDSESRDLFQQDLGNDSKLADEFFAHSGTVHLIQKAFDRKILRKRIIKIHHESFGDKDLMIHLKTERRRRIFIATGQLAAAASVAAIVTVALLYMLNGLGMSHKDAYMELRNEVQDIYSTQEVLKREIKRSNEPQVLFTGSSFALTSNGILATNYHVIRGLDSVWVSNYTDSLIRYTAAIVYSNPETDIALLKIVDPQFKGFGTLPYSRSNTRAEMGEYVFTLGFSKQDVVFGEGSVSSVSGYKSDTTSYQVSIPVNPGNSGGPLFDSKGYLLGMISGKNTLKEGVGFAVKSEYLFAALAELDKSDLENSPAIKYKNRISGKKRPDQLKTLQPLVFRVQIAR